MNSRRLVSIRASETGNRAARARTFFNRYPCEHFQIYDGLRRHLHHSHVGGVHVHYQQHRLFELQVHRGPVAAVQPEVDRGFLKTPKFNVGRAEFA